MSFLNNLGQKISDVSQTTIKKTKDLADTAKLNLKDIEIKNENNKKVPIHINHFNTGKEDKNE